jgi:hypothetical protein
MIIIIINNDDNNNLSSIRSTEMLPAFHKRILHSLKMSPQTSTSFGIALQDQFWNPVRTNPVTVFFSDSSAMFYILSFLEHITLIIS